MTKPIATAIATAVAVIVVAGCGDASSPGDASDARQDAATAVARASAAAVNRGSAAPVPKVAARPSHEATFRPAPVPPGVPLNARDRSVKKAIAILLHPGDSDGGDGSARGESQAGVGAHQDGALEILNQIRRAAREHVEQPGDGNQRKPPQLKGPAILEMLR